MVTRHAQQVQSRFSRRAKELAVFAAVLLCFNLWLMNRISAFGTYSNRIPNFNVNQCASCHEGGFKAAFAANNRVWNSALAGQDSDGDGFTNGEELQDLTSSWSMGQTDPGNSALVSSPTSTASIPPAPTMTAFTGISAASTISGNVSVAVSLSTTAGGNPVGIAKVEYSFLTAGTTTVITTFQTTATPFMLNINTANVPNGTYDVVATVFDKRAAGQGGARTAAITRANVTVANVPVITAQPTAQFSAPDGTVNFNVTATGATSFQWRKDGANLANGAQGSGSMVSGATTASLTITTVKAGDVGNYDVIATNAAGSTTSSPAALVVGAQTSNSNVRLVSQRSINQNSGDANSSLPNTVGGTAALNGASRPISADGRVIAFRSTSTNLTPNDSTGTQDVYARDLKAGTTVLVSATPNNLSSGDAQSDTCIVSAGGGFVGFTSSARNLVNGITMPNTNQRCYRRDLTTNTTLAIGVVSGATTGVGDVAAGNTEIAGISSDGRYVLFFADGSSTLDPGKPHTGGSTNYYLRDTVANTTRLVTVNSAGNGTANAPCSGGVMSTDGRFVTFNSSATNLGPGISDGFNHIYRWDRDQATPALAVQLVDIDMTTPTTAGNMGADSPAISADGRFIAFSSASTNLNAGDASTVRTIYRRDMNSTTMVIVNEAFNSTNAGSGIATAPAISATGQFVSYTSDDSDLIGVQAATDANTITDIFRRDMNSATTTKNVAVSAQFGTATTLSDGASANSRISDDGRYVAFESAGTNLSDPMASIVNNASNDVFRRDCQTLDTILLSVRTDLEESGNGNSNTPFLSGNGETAIFNSSASDLWPQDVNGMTGDAFVATFNRAPVVSVFNGAVINVGETYTSGGSFTDANGGDNHTARVDYGDGSGLQTLTLNGSAFSLSHQYLAAGTFQVRVIVTDSANANTVSAASVIVNKLATTTSLVSSGSPVNYQQPLTFTATVSGAQPGITATGVVEFKAANTVIGSAAIDANGVAALTLSTLLDGNYQVVAAFTGDSAYDSSNSTPLAQTITPTAPSITSSLTASVARDAAFEYVITSNGSNPITYQVSALPAGLSFDFNTITGTPTVAGTAAIVLTATNAVGSDVKTLQLTISKPAGAANTAPTITSGPTATPNPARAGETVTFTAAASDADNDIIALLWDFGDGTTGSGATTTHTYAAAGIYTVKLSVKDDSATTEATLTVAVNAAAGGGGPESSELTILKGGIKFDFKKNSDSLTLSGTVPTGSGFNPNNKTAALIIAGYRKNFTFGTKGKAGTELSLTGKRAKDGAFTTATQKFSVKLKGQKLFDELKGFGFENATLKTKNVENVPIILILDDDAYADTVKFIYKSSQGKSGSGKLVP